MAYQEECDDGNRLNGDGCSRQCLLYEEKPSTVAASTATFSNQLAYPSGPIDLSSNAFAFGQPNAALAVQQRFGQFPGQPNVSALPVQLPLAQLQPLIQSQGPVGDTGPATVAITGAGMAAGWSWMRRRRRK